MGILQDKNGKISSKRIFGGLLIIAGIFISCWGTIFQHDVSGMLWPTLTTGAALLGVTVMERKD